MAAEVEDHFTLLTLPDGAIGRIAYLLPPGDRGKLAATCTALRAAGRRWFSGTVVRVEGGDSRLAELTHWLEERQALVAYNLSGSAQSIQADLAALPAGHAIAIRGFTLVRWAAPAVVAPLTALTELHLIHQRQLSSSTQLEQILRPLVQLRIAGLISCKLAAVPAALPCCTQLVHLDLRSNPLAGGWQHLQPLVQLRRLLLQANDLAEVPAAIAALTALEHLRLGSPQSGWQHLRPLAQLQSFDALRCWGDAPETQLLLASEAAANLHPAAVQRMLAEPDGPLPRLLNMLAQRGLPRPV